ncbi:aliphatic sulfonates family ABC transporter, periplasmic ligand-binding protein [Methanobacterium lacus]|uniref:Aliphatic sulfonates family ABC transporter, periplasmic ligand-binding protein n=1 Tax=Methanobacterium lacus (strain AL-21) TaxID=877455 RepID=F0T9D7_METLA|nr:ABC transporter substrate-binding protein [Methanobacterium lacus]ADZ09888.1 aliphatic sulfonates family ABC transporter, periplasmic ligand-binding protein [Methanobacterium lacus]
MNQKRTVLIVLGVLIVVGLALTTTYSSSDTNKIKVAYIPCDHDAALFIALAQNKYSANGLNVEPTSISTGSSIVSALASGDIDVGYIGIAPALQGIAEGVPIKIVGAVNEDGSGIVVNTNSDINNTTDLVGKKIATPGVSSIQQVLLLYQLAKYNITKNQVDISSVNIFMLPSTLASDKVDGYIAYEPYVSIAPFTNVGRVLMYSDEIMPNHPCCVIVARQDFIDQHPQELQTFLDIHKNCTEFANNNTNQTASLVSDELTTNPELEKTALKHVIFVSQLNNDFQTKVLDFMNIEIEMGYLKKNLTSSQIFDSSFLGD